MTRPWTGSTRAALATTLAATALGAAAQAPAGRPGLTPQSVQQKAAMLEKVLASASLAERVAASRSEMAAHHVANARELLGYARLLAGNHELAPADGLLNQAIQEISRAQRIVPQAASPQAEQAARYSRLLSQAAAPLAGQTLVAGRSFATPREEYEFELERHRSLERLVPLALAQLRPPAELRALVDHHAAIARRQRESGEAVAADDPAAAVRHVTDGTESLRRALQAAGLNVPQTLGAEK